MRVDLIEVHEPCYRWKHQKIGEGKIQLFCSVCLSVWLFSPPPRKESSCIGWARQEAKHFGDDPTS